jgi:hypothetical protein
VKIDAGTVLILCFFVVLVLGCIIAIRLPQ